MKLILSLAGIMAVWTGIKFVFLVFKRLCNKSNMNDTIDRLEENMANSADKVAGYLKKKKRARKKKKIEERPIVTIR